MSVRSGGLCFHGGGARTVDRGLFRGRCCHPGCRCCSLCFHADATGQEKRSRECQQTDDVCFHKLTLSGKRRPSMGSSPHKSPRGRPAGKIDGSAVNLRGSMSACMFFAVAGPCFGKIPRRARLLSSPITSSRHGGPRPTTARRGLLAVGGADGGSGRRFLQPGQSLLRQAPDILQREG